MPGFEPVAFEVVAYFPGFGAADFVHLVWGEAVACDSGCVEVEEHDEFEVGVGEYSAVAGIVSVILMYRIEGTHTGARVCGA